MTHPKTPDATDELIERTKFLIDTAIEVASHHGTDPKTSGYSSVLEELSELVDTVST